MASTQDVSQTLLQLLKGSNQGNAQGDRCPVQAYHEERDDFFLEVYEKERLLSTRELHKWKKSLFSVYVGRLPPDVTVRELAQIFVDGTSSIPKDVFIVPPEGSKSYTYGFLRYGTLAEARKAVSCMNGRILGNRHLLVEISAETRSYLNNEEKDICDAGDRLLKKEYPTVRRRSSSDGGEEVIQSKLIQSIAKLKSDEASVVDGCTESSGPSFLDKLEKILQKVIKEVLGETTTSPTADEGPACTINIEDSIDNIFGESQLEPSALEENDSFPVQVQRSVKHALDVLSMGSKTSAASAELSLQELNISEEQSQTKSSSLDPYMLSKMREIPCQDVRLNSRKSPISQTDRSPVNEQVCFVGRTDAVLDAPISTPLSQVAETFPGSNGIDLVQSGHKPRRRTPSTNGTSAQISTDHKPVRQSPSSPVYENGINGASGQISPDRQAPSYPVPENSVNGASGKRSPYHEPVRQTPCTNTNVTSGTNDQHLVASCKTFDTLKASDIPGKDVENSPQLVQCNAKISPVSIQNSLRRRQLPPIDKKDVKVEEKRIVSSPTSPNDVISRPDLEEKRKSMEVSEANRKKSLSSDPLNKEEREKENDISPSKAELILQNIRKSKGLSPERQHVHSQQSATSVPCLKPQQQQQQHHKQQQQQQQQHKPYVAMTEAGIIRPSNSQATNGPYGNFIPSPHWASNMQGTHPTPAKWILQLQQQQQALFNLQRSYYATYGFYNVRFPLWNLPVFAPHPVRPSFVNPLLFSTLPQGTCVGQPHSREVSLEKMERNVKAGLSSDGSLSLTNVTLPKNPEETSDTVRNSDVVSVEELKKGSPGKTGLASGEERNSEDSLDLDDGKKVKEIEVPLPATSGEFIEKQPILQKEQPSMEQEGTKIQQEPGLKEEQENPVQEKELEYPNQGTSSLQLQLNLGQESQLKQEQHQQQQQQLFSHVEEEQPNVQQNLRLKEQTFPQQELILEREEAEQRKQVELQKSGSNNCIPSPPPQQRQQQNHSYLKKELAPVQQQRVLKHQPHLQQQADQVHQPHLLQADQVQQPHLHQQAHQVQQPHLHQQADQVQQPHLHQQADQVQQPHLHQQADQVQQPHLQQQADQVQQPHLHQQAHQVQQPHLQQQADLEQVLSNDVQQQQQYLEQEYPHYRRELDHEHTQAKDQEEKPALQEHLISKQRSLRELKLRLGEILKENERLHSSLPEHYQDKRTAGMYPDKEMVSLEESIHSHEVEYQREMEITVARNAEHELLYEREKLSAGFDADLQKELDMEFKMEMLKNEIKLANMANQLLIFYQKRNEMQ